MGDTASVMMRSRLWLPSLALKRRKERRERGRDRRRELGREEERE